MIVEIRIYKRFDTDLVAISDAGYSLAALMKEALVSYANGTPVTFLLNEVHDYNPVDKNSVHIRIRIPDSDVKTCYMLRNVKKSYRNTFCKCLLRNALAQQNLNAFFADKNLYQLQNINLQGKPLNYTPNVKVCSDYKKGNKTGVGVNVNSGVVGGQAQYNPFPPMPQVIPNTPVPPVATPVIPPVAPITPAVSVQQVAKPVQPQTQSVSDETVTSVQMDKQEKSDNGRINTPVIETSKPNEPEPDDLMSIFDNL